MDEKCIRIGKSSRYTSAKHFCELKLELQLSFYEY